MVGLGVSREEMRRGWGLRPLSAGGNSVESEIDPMQLCFAVWTVPGRRFGADPPGLAPFAVGELEGLLLAGGAVGVWKQGAVLFMRY